MEPLLLAIAAAIVAGGLYRLAVVKVVVQQFETGLLYRNGKFRRRVGPGAYRLLKTRSRIVPVDLRRRVVVVPGQEVLSADNVAVKASVAVTYEVEDPEAAVHRVQSFAEALYIAVQLALRSAVGERKIDELLERRAEIGRDLQAPVTAEAAALGLKVRSVELRDITFPGEIKRIFAEVVRAQKEGQAALERARGETAALRNLANAAKMMEDNPMLLNLRVLQSLSAGAGGGPGHTVVLGVPQGFVPVGKKEPGPRKPDTNGG